MAIELTWLGHGSWLIEASGSRIVLDPFPDGNPTAPRQAAPRAPPDRDSSVPASEGAAVRPRPGAAEERALRASPPSADGPPAD